MRPDVRMSDEERLVVANINLVAALLEEQVKNLRRYIKWGASPPRNRAAVGAALIGHNAMLALGNTASLVHEHTKDIARQVGKLEGKG